MNQMMRWRSHCTCGCNPCRCDDWCQDWCDPCAGLSAEQRACLKQLLREVANEGGLFGPIHGVTDGSNAAPGDVGEYVILTSTMSFAAYPAITTTSVSGGVLQPGDWNITSWISFNTAIGQASFVLSPVPAGMSNNMEGILFVSTIGTTQPIFSIAIIPGITARGSFSIPTLLPFSIMVDQANDANLTAGIATLTVEARRMR